MWEWMCIFRRYKWTDWKRKENDGNDNNTIRMKYVDEENQTGNTYTYVQRAWEMMQFILFFHLIFCALFWMYVCVFVCVHRLLFLLRNVEDASKNEMLSLKWKSSKLSLIEQKQTCILERNKLNDRVKWVHNVVKLSIEDLFRAHCKNWTVHVIWSSVYGWQKKKCPLPPELKYKTSTL